MQSPALNLPGFNESPKSRQKQANTIGKYYWYISLHSTTNIKDMETTVNKEPATAAFEAALKDRFFSNDRNSPDYVGRYMYMGTGNDGKAQFKHQLTREYVTHTPMTSANDAVELSFCHCTDGYFHLPFFKDFSYTSGVRKAAQTWNCYWLIEMIFSHQGIRLSRQPFQVWDLVKHPTEKMPDRFTMVCTDGNDTELIRQEIEFSDFPFETFRLFLTNSVLLLPSEY